MFGATFLGYCFTAAGVLLLLPALASFTIGGPGSCRRLFWIHDLVANVVGPEAASVLSGSIWLLVAAAFFFVGFRLRSRNGAKRAV